MVMNILSFISMSELLLRLIKEWKLEGEMTKIISDRYIAQVEALSNVNTKLFNQAKIEGVPFEAISALLNSKT